tara:strand:- start:7396 stop:7986 length:591 start_codon:yes stop_codon:yes gene_type:complete
MYVIKDNYKVKETFKNLCNKNKFIEENQFTDDNQNVSTSEFTNAKFKAVLSGKQFEIMKNREKDVDTVKTKTIIENWLNDLKALKKKGSKLNIVKFEEFEENAYELYIYRNGRNHGKIIHLKMNENDEKYIISNIKIIGILTEYEMLFDNMNSYNNDAYLKYNKLEDMWIATKDERLTNEYVDLNEIYNEMSSFNI